MKKTSTQTRRKTAFIRQFAMTSALLLGLNSTFAQTTIISPTGDGGFETGGTLAANGWTVQNYTTNNTNKWFAGTAAVASAGSNSAYISNDAAGLTYNFSNTTASRVMFWRDVVFPSGETSITLSFKIKVEGEDAFDDLSVFIQNGSTVPTVTTQPSPSSTSSPSITGTTRLTTLSILGSTYVTRTLTISAADAGNASAATTRRLIFYWENDGSGGVNPPASIDEISLVSALPPPPPANDNASGAVALTVNPAIPCGTTTNGTTVSATPSPDAAPGTSCSPTGINDDVWFSFVATSAAHRIAFTNVINGTMAVALYTGTPGNLTAVAGACASTALNATGLIPGTTYYARAYTSTATVATTTTFTICVSTLPPPPANDECANAIALVVQPHAVSGCTGSISGTTVSATSSSITAPPSSAWATSQDDDVWYEFTATYTSHIIRFCNVTFPIGTAVDMGLSLNAGCTASNPELAGPTVTLSSGTGSYTASGLTVGTLYKVRVLTSGTASRANFDISVMAPPAMSYVSSTTTQSSTSSVSAGSSNQQILRVAVEVTGAANPLSLTEMNFNTTGTNNTANVSNAKVYYTGTSSTFGTTNQFGTTVANPNGTFTVTGSQVLSGAVANTTNYFWLTYDLTCTANSPDTVDAQCTAINVNGLQTPTATNPAGSRLITGLVTTNQPASSSVTAGGINAQVLRVDVLPCGSSSSVESINFSTTGSTAPASDILTAKVYYTTSTTFSSATLFGTAVPNPNGTFTVTGNQSITAIGYFWLVYDLNCAATVSNVIDASCTAVTVSGISYPTATPNPAGTRAITAPIYTAAITQASTGIVPQGGINQLIVYATLSGCVNTPVTSITFGTTGTTSTADIAAARVYYTTGTTFSNAIQFGTAITNPGAAMTFTGSQPLATGTGYFWLVYDIAAAATVANVVDASLSSSIINGVTTTPTTTTATGTRAIVTPVANDNASGAIALVVGAGCTTNPYNNTNATQSFDEPFPSCEGAPGNSTLWFSFTAPASGSVKVSNDGSGTLGDSKIALFSASNVNDYSTFTILACDDDNGVTIAARSLFYASGLTPGTTYYILVDGYGTSSTKGSFCVTVDELSSSMLATAASSCTAGDGNAGLSTSYNGWISMVDGTTGNLIANIRQTAGTASTYAASRTIVTGTARTDANGQSYLNRNFFLNATSGTATSADIQLFFTDAEVSNLGVALSALNVSRFAGTTCTANVSGTGTMLPQTAGSSANGVSWIQVTTPGFSNFFINGTPTPLPVVLKNFSGKNAGLVNNLNWETAEEKNFSHFELQRSADGIHFNSITQVEANRNSTGSHYAYTDASPFEGINIYRLSMVDRDGQSSLSEVVTLTVKGGKGISIQVYPNPVKEELQITIAGKADGQARIQVLDITGKLVRSVLLNNNAARVDMRNLPSGMYLVKYVDNSHASVTKITKD